MPTLKYRLPKLCQHKGQGYVKLNGRVIYLGPWGHPETAQRYHEVIGEWLAHGRDVPAAQPQLGPVSVVELVRDYWRWAKRRYAGSKGEVASIKSALSVLVRAHGRTPAAEYGPRKLRDVRALMVHAGWSRQHINRQISRIRSAFNWSVAEELIPAETANRLAMLRALRKGEARETDPVKPVPSDDLWPAIHQMNKPVRGLVLLQLLTGARPGELLKLRAMDIDMSGAVWSLNLADHKTAHHGKRRVILFGPKAKRILRYFIAEKRSTSAYLFDPRDSNLEGKRRGASGSRRPNQQVNAKKTDRSMNEHYTPSSYGRHVRRACDKAGVSTWSPGRLRHNAATYLRAQFGVEVTSKVLGHSNIRTTEIYAEADERKAAQAILRFG